MRAASGRAPRVAVFRSAFRGRVQFASPGWVLEETPDHVVLAMVPGAQTAQLSGPRDQQLARLATGTEQVREMAWHTNRVVWLMPLGGAAHAISHFWDDASGAFLGYYVNMQAPLRRTTLGFDSVDHVLDVVVAPDGAWRWKDEDELGEAVRLGMFDQRQAAAIRAEGERVIARLPSLLPTGWETWLPDPAWPPLRLPAGWDRVDPAGRQAR
jgi:Protein of unknown function (DUF402)